MPLAGLTRSHPTASGKLSRSWFLQIWMSLLSRSYSASMGQRTGLGMDVIQEIRDLHEMT